MEKDEIGPEAERAAFVMRLEEVCAALGSRAALAKRAGIAATSLQAYFQQSEPTRAALVNLARAANVSVGWLASGSPPRNPNGLPDSCFAMAFYDLRATGGHIYPLLSGPSEFRVFNKSEFQEVGGRDLIAIQTLEGLEPWINESDTIVVDRKDAPSIGSGLPRSTVFPLEEGAIYAVARKARINLRRLRWKKPGESLIVLLPRSNAKPELTVTEKRLDLQILGRVVWRGGAAIELI
jgi:hypothetical protein